jgi:flagella basal body P-ring formation protein FlgA
VVLAWVGAGGRPTAARPGQVAGAPESAIRQAIVEVVRARMGMDADVRVEDVHAHVLAGNEDMMLLATPEPGGRLARPTRFALFRAAAGSPSPVPPRPAGYAVASVFVAVPHVRATQSVARGDACDAANIALSTDEVGDLLLQRLPRLEEAVGARAVRDLAPGEVLTRAVLAARPFVQSGDVVVVRARADGVTVRGQAVAEQSGGQGDVIRVVNRESRRALRARVVGRGEVEVVQ